MFLLNLLLNPSSRTMASFLEVLIILLGLQSKYAQEVEVGLLDTLSKWIFVKPYNLFPTNFHESQETPHLWP